MTDLYLILHKVRGEPTFDIAQRLEIADEDGWIIPTSGHRAYPFHMWPLLEFSYEQNVIDGGGMAKLAHYGIKLPDDWPDHYPRLSSPSESRTEANDLLTSLGLPTKVHNAVTGTLKRRI